MIETAMKELGQQGLDFQPLLQRPGAEVPQVVLEYLHSTMWEACTKPACICSGTAPHLLLSFMKNIPVYALYAQQNDNEKKPFSYILRDCICVRRLRPRVVFAVLPLQFQ